MNSVGGAPQHSALSRVAAVGPYIQSIPTSSAQGPPVLNHMETLVKSTYPDSNSTLAMQDSSLKPPPRPVKPAAGERREVFVSFCAEQETEKLHPPSSIFILDSFALYRVRYIQNRHTVGIGGLVCGVWQRFCPSLHPATHVRPQPPRLRSVGLFCL